MLNLQRYLRNGGTPEKLKKEKGIDFYHHPDFPLVGFKYGPNSPMTDDAVREANGCVLDKDANWHLIAKGFDRLFNIDEVPDEQRYFDWGSLECVAREDGTTVLVYYYANEWLVNTLDSFGLSKLTDKGYAGTWQDLFWKHAGNLRGKLRHVRTDFTYVFNLCTPINKIVKKYKDPSIFLIGIVHCHNGRDRVNDMFRQDCDAHSRLLGVQAPKWFQNLRGEKGVKKLFETKKEDSTFMGVIVRDGNGRRYEWKTESYKMLHKFLDNGNIIKPANLTSIVMTGKRDEVATKIPEVAPALTEVSEIIDKAFAETAEAWLSHKGSKTQKDFAKKVKGHPFVYILFKMRKEGAEVGTVEKLREIWNHKDNHVKIAKRLFGKRKFKLAELTT